MSVHPIPPNIDIGRLSRLITQALRAPSGLVAGNGTNQPPTALEFTPDLSAAEQATLDRVIGAAQKAVDFSPGEYQAIKDEVATLAAYLGNNSPTAAQTAAALKALIRVVRQIVRE